MDLQLDNIRPQDYSVFQRFLETTSGIVLNDNKQYLIASRLGHLMRERGISDFGDLVRRLTLPGEQALRNHVIEAMTTNETQWFRDSHPFDALKFRIFPELERAGRRHARIWSAASSTGQEAYSISMAYEEYRQLNPARYGDLPTLEVVGTDISPRVIDHAVAGVYPDSMMRRGLSEERWQRFFLSRGDGFSAVRPEIRQRVAFRQHNLLENFALLGRFDVIFCRNVLIYFSLASRHDILGRMLQTLNPGGYLILGGSESLSGYTDRLEMVRYQNGILYRLRTGTPSILQSANGARI